MYLLVSLKQMKVLLCDLCRSFVHLWKNCLLWFNLRRNTDIHLYLKEVIVKLISGCIYTHFKLIEVFLYILYYVFLIHKFHILIFNQYFRPFLLVTRDNATYNCPCVNTCFFKYTPTFDNVCPWLLLMVIE